MPFSKRTGTGTVAGDTAELETVSRMLAQFKAAPNNHAIGSIKALIGHTKAAAGIAGLIKAALACHHKILPPHADIDGTERRSSLESRIRALYLIDEAQPWLAQPGIPRRAAASAFGFGGTNFHVTLQEYDQALDAEADEAPRRNWPRELLIWRGADRASVAAAVRKTADRVAAGAQPLLRDLAHTLSRNAPKSGLTAALVVGPNEQIAHRIAALAAHMEQLNAPLPPGSFFNETPLISGGGKLALIFPGQGAQYAGMMRELAVLFPEMRAVLERADATLAARMSEKGLPGGNLSRAIFGRALYDDAARTAAAQRLTRTDIAQPALGAVEAGLLEVLERLGVRADMTAGHSYGEFVALYAAGVMTLEELLIVSEARGRFMIEAAAGGDLGTMAAVRADRARVERAVEGAAEVWVANHNAPTQTVLSGSKAGIVAAAKAPISSAPGCSSQPIPVAGAAFHSPIVAPAAADPLAAKLIRELPLKPPGIAVYSNQTAQSYPSDNVEALRDVLAKHLVSPVQFVAEIEWQCIASDGSARVFLSVGPKGAQASMVRQILEGKPHRAVVCDDGSGGVNGLLQSVGALLAEGAELDLERLWRGRDCRLLRYRDSTSPPRRSAARRRHRICGCLMAAERGRSAAPNTAGSRPLRTRPKLQRATKSRLCTSDPAGGNENYRHSRCLKTNRICDSKQKDQNLNGAAWVHAARRH